MLERECTCCNCGQDFTATGYGQYVTCPFCGTELHIMDGRDKEKPRPSYNSVNHNYREIPKLTPQQQSSQPKPNNSLEKEPKQEQNIAPVVISALAVVAIFIGVVIFATFNMEKPKPVPQQDSSLPYYPENSGSDYSSSYDYNSNTQSESSSSSSNTGFQTNTSNTSTRLSTGSNYVLPVQDAEEDAYEEARSLKEEDIMNRTRNYEGDGFDKLTTG